MKQTVQLGSLAAANIGIAFLFQWHVFTQLGAGIQTDAVFATMTLTQLVLVVISGSLMHVPVPLRAGQGEDYLYTLTGYKPQTDFSEGVALSVRLTAHITKNKKR